MASLTLRTLTRPGDHTKNAPLTNAEVDTNFINLDADLDLKAPIDSPTFTGVPTAPTPLAGDNSAQLATTKFVAGALSPITTDLALKAPLESPSLTGAPTAPTAPLGTNTTQVATTEFVAKALVPVNTDVVLRAPIESPAFTGVPAAPTAVAGTNTTQLATTEFVTSAISPVITSINTTNTNLSTLGSTVAGIQSTVTTLSNAIDTTGDTVTFDSTGAIEVPAGTNAQRPATPAEGALRYNTTTDKFEGYSNGAWSVIGSGDVTAAGAQTLSNKTLVNPVINDGYTEEIYTASLSGSVALNPANGSIQLITHAGNITFTDSLAAGQSVLLGLTPGANTTTWPTITWTKVGGGGAAPTLTATGVNWIVLWKIDTTLRGSFLGTA